MLDFLLAFEPVPEPGSVILLGLGVFSVAMFAILTSREKRS